MKPLIPLLVLAAALAASRDTHAQSTPDGGKVVQYTYDASGNRIKRTVTVQTKSPSAIGDSIPDPYEYISLTATPNPTNGMAIVVLSGIENQESLSLGLYNLEGTILLQGDITDSVQLDLSSYPAGWYVVRIHFGETVKSVKILKI